MPGDSGTITEPDGPTLRDRWINALPQSVLEVEVLGIGDRPVVGAAVLATTGSEGIGEVVRFGTTDGQGKARIRVPVVHRGVGIIATKDGAVAREWVRHPTAPTQYVRLFLGTVAIRVHVDEGNGTPVPGAVVSVPWRTNEGEDRQVSGTTSASGDVVLEGVNLGAQNVEVHAARHASVTQQVSVEAVGENRFAFTLDRAEGLELTCLCGAAPCSARVFIRDTASARAFEAACDEHGRLSRDDVPALAYRIEGIHGWQTATEATGTLEAKPVAGETLKAVLRLTPSHRFTATLEGTVRSAAGRVVAGAVIDAFCDARKPGSGPWLPAFTSARAVTDAQGRYRLENLPPGRCQLSAASPGPARVDTQADAPGQVDFEFRTVAP